MFKISAFIFLMIIGSANASILEFSKGDGVKSNEVNSNLEYLKNEIQSAIHTYDYIPFESGQLISAEALNTEFNKLIQFGLLFTPFIEGEKITAESFNSRFQEIQNSLQNLPQGIIVSGEVRTYFDGTLANSCYEYLTRNDRRWKYSGNTGSGYYRIKFADSVEQVVYCDMSTDGGGWTLIMHQQTTTMSLATTSAVNDVNLRLRNANAKMVDSRIKELAKNREAYIVHGNNRAIYRYSQSLWNSYSSVGWANANFDAKSSAGSWQLNRCNGHYNNRGFSTWNDRSDSACPVMYTGSPIYFTNYHTNSWGSSVSHKAITSVFVR